MFENLSTGDPMADDATKRARGRPKTFDREHTLDVAIDSYWRDGVDAASVNEICRRVGTSKPGLYREFGGVDQLMDAALVRYGETVFGPVLASLSEDRPFRETLAALIDFATREEFPEVPSGCLFAKMRGVRSRLGSVTAEQVDTLCEDAVAAYAAWLEGRANRGEIELPAPIETITTHVDARLTMMLTRTAAGEDPATVRAHADLALSVLARPSSDGR